jgi:uncharacterized protein YdeI (YjbR/CyaY-like superfamily)
VEPLPELIVADADTWRSWLAEHHTRTDGVRLVLAKKGTTDPTSLTYDAALRHALCFGWIDGQVGRRDEGTFVQRFTPRRSRSMWSVRNIGLVAELTEAGLMQPSGVAQVERAQADGRWDVAYEGPGSIVVPDDLAAAVAGSRAAQAMWDVLTSQNRYAILHRLHQVKRAETRERKLVGYVEMLARGETIYPQKRRP